MLVLSEVHVHSKHGARVGRRITNVSLSFWNRRQTHLPDTPVQPGGVNTKKCAHP